MGTPASHLHRPIQSDGPRVFFPKTCTVGDVDTVTTAPTVTNPEQSMVLTLTRPGVNWRGKDGEHNGGSHIDVQAAQGTVDGGERLHGGDDPRRAIPGSTLLHRPSQARGREQQSRATPCNHHNHAERHELQGGSPGGSAEHPIPAIHRHAQQLEVEEGKIRKGSAWCLVYSPQLAAAGPQLHPTSTVIVAPCADLKEKGAAGWAPHARGSERLSGWSNGPSCHRNATHTQVR
jgi:hypothetical protein